MLSVSEPLKVGLRYKRSSLNRYINGELRWSALYVCNLLKYKNGRVAITQHCKAKGITKCYTPTNGGIQDLIYIYEYNLYRLISIHYHPLSISTSKEIRCKAMTSIADAEVVVISL